MKRIVYLLSLVALVLASYYCGVKRSQVEHGITTEATESDTVYITTTDTVTIYDDGRNPSIRVDIDTTHPMGFQYVPVRPSPVDRYEYGGWFVRNRGSPEQIALGVAINDYYKDLPAHAYSRYRWG